MAYCEIAGSVVGYDGETLQAGSVLKVFRAISAAGSIIASDEEAYTFKSDGSWTPLLRFERASIVYVHLNAPGYDLDEVNGTPLQIPDAPTATLVSIASAVDVPEQVPIAFPSKRMIITPHVAVYDLAGNVLAVGLLINLGATEVVPAGKLFCLIRGSEGDGGYLVFEIGASAQVDFDAAFLQAHADSDVSSILHGTIRVVSNDGPGTAKAIYGRAISEPGSTGPAIAGVFAVEAIPGAEGWITQLTGTDDTDYAALIHALDRVSADFNNGHIFDKNVRMRTGGRFYGAYRTPAYDGDFVSYREQDETPLFSVNHFGQLDAPNVDCKRSTLVMDVNSTAYQDLYSVPAGKTLVATRLVLRGASVDLTTFVAALSARETETNAVISDSDITAYFANARTYKQILLDAATIPSLTVSEGFKVQVKVDAAFGSAATLIVDLFGYFM